MKRRQALTVFVVGVCLQVIFPPWMHEGQWQSEKTKRVATVRQNHALNREYFGYIPEYHPFWSHPQANRGSIGVGLDIRFVDSQRASDIYSLKNKNRTLTIDWAVFGVQLALYCVFVGGCLFLAVSNHD